MAQLLELLGERDHLGDVIRRARVLVRGKQVEQRRVGVEGRLVGIGDLAGGPPLEPRRDEHRIHLVPGGVFPEMPHVGDVLDVQDLQPVVQEGASDQVGEEERPEVPDVRVAVDGRATGVHPDATGLERFDGQDLARRRGVSRKRTAPMARSQPAGA